MSSLNNGIEIRQLESRIPTDQALHLFEHGAEHLEAGRYEQALESLHSASKMAPDHARIRSLLGLAIAHCEADFEQARTLCESAARQEFFNPEVYLNLASVYLVFGRRAEALRYLRRGQMIDPGHAEIARRIGDLGRRRMPVIPFLPRRHPINRALGGARNLITATLFRRDAA